jgi:hypothetical protein
VTRRHSKVAFLIPGGNVIGRDHVVAYHHDDPKKIVDTDINIGDTFVFEATLRLVDFDEAVFVSIDAGNVDRVVEELDSCEVAILRGSNYIHAAMNWGQLGVAIERSRMPVVAFGIGAQAPRYEPIQVSAETERVLKVIAERSRSVGCRGSFTADTLHKMGVSNAVPIGCPRLFRLNNRDLRIQPPEAGSIRRVGFTIARGVSGMYCDSPNLARMKQLKAIEELSQRYDVFLVTQSEKSEKIFYYRMYHCIDEAKTLMKKSGWDIDRMPWLEQLYWSRIFFGSSSADYEAIVRFFDLTLGYRLHGNIMSLSVGKPAIYHTYDSRTRELVEHFAIPSHDIMSEHAFSFDEMLSSSAFDKFNARVPRAYDEMRAFLEDNGVPNRMMTPEVVSGTRGTAAA